MALAIFLVPAFIERVTPRLTIVAGACCYWYAFAARLVIAASPSYFQPLIQSSPASGFVPQRCWLYAKAVQPSDQVAVDAAKVVIARARGAMYLILQVQTLSSTSTDTQHSRFNAQEP